MLCCLFVVGMVFVVSLSCLFFVVCHCIGCLCACCFCCSSDFLLSAYVAEKIEPDPNHMRGPCRSALHAAGLLLEVEVCAAHL